MSIRTSQRPRLLFFVEGFTDIRFVVGLSEIACLTLCVPQLSYGASGLRERVAAAGINVSVHEIAGGRAAYQLRSAAWLLKHASEFDVILSQELLRGSLNATVIGNLRRVPVVTTLMIAPVEYFRCRARSGQIGRVAALAGELGIRSLMTVNGRLSTRCVALGEYLREIAGAYCSHVVSGGYYGVDTKFFSPVDHATKLAIRRRLQLPADAFLVFLASRISHEKDPVTVLRAVSAARRRGLNAVVMNLSGGFREFLALARGLDAADGSNWVIGREAVHPMTALADYFRAADCTVQASFAEGLGLSPLESLACGVPVIATAVGGMARTLPGFATLTSPGDAAAMADALAWVAANPAEAREQALRGSHMVAAQWSREKAFGDLRQLFDEILTAH